VLCTSHIISLGRQCQLFVRYRSAGRVHGRAVLSWPSSPLRVATLFSAFLLGLVCYVNALLCCKCWPLYCSALKRTSWDGPWFLAPWWTKKDLARLAFLASKVPAAGQRGGGTLRCCGQAPALADPVLRAWRSCDQARAGTSLLGRCCKLLGGWCSAALWIASWGPCLKSAVDQSLLLFHSLFPFSLLLQPEQISISSSPSLPPSPPSATSHSLSRTVPSYSPVGSIFSTRESEGRRRFRFWAISTRSPSHIRTRAGT
jgi:hypothetical protein